MDLSGLNYIANMANQSNPLNDGDFVVDGIVHCAICGEPKQIKLNNPHFDRTVGKLCKCKREALKKEREEFEKRQERDYITDVKNYFLQDKAVQDMRFEQDKGYNAKILNFAKKYAKEYKHDMKGLLFYGNVGAGKTFVTACISNYLLDNGISVLFTSLNKIIKSMQNYEADKIAILENLNNYSLLILDDLGTERTSEYAMEIVFDVIDGRYKAKKPMIINTNLSIEEIENPKNIGYKRIYDRVLGMCIPVCFKNESIRKIERLENEEDLRNFFKEG